MTEEPVVTFEEQNLGDLHKTIRVNTAGQRGVERLYPDGHSNHIDAVKDIREVLDEHYGEHIARLSGEGEEVIITRLVVHSDDIPHIEYSVAPKS